MARTSIRRFGGLNGAQGRPANSRLLLRCEVPLSAGNSDVLSV
jgi:hypothetical protein